jgi:hypothetical protein
LFLRVPGEGYSIPGEGYSIPGEGYSIPGEGYSIPGEGYSRNVPFALQQLSTFVLINIL